MDRIGERRYPRLEREERAEVTFTDDGSSGKASWTGALSGHGDAGALAVVRNGGQDRRRIAAGCGTPGTATSTGSTLRDTRPRLAPLSPKISWIAAAVADRDH